MIGGIICVALAAALVFWAIGSREVERVAPAAVAAPVAPASADVTPTESEQAVAERQLANCRLKAVAGDRVLAESRTVLAGWAEHLGATADFDAQKITIEARASTWQRTAADAGSSLKRRSEAITAYAGVPECQWVAGAPGDLAKRLDACSLRLTMVKRAMDSADRPVSDWTRHLKDEAAHAADPKTQGDWERGWLGRRYAFDEWADADKKYAGAPACG
ncbi:hypothetical protein [Mariniluteicoccus flavus]